MARRLAWSDVRGGLFASIAIAVIAVATLKFSQLGVLRGDTFVLIARFGEARGLLRGSEVWLSGQKIGKVTSIEFLPPSRSDTSARIEIAMEALEKFRTSIHRDAVAQIRPGGSLIGPPVVYISPGTVAAPPLQSGDTVSTHPQADVEGATGQFSVASREFPAIINNVKVLAAQLSTTQGTVGAFLNSGAGPGAGQFTRMGNELERLSTSLQSTGTMGSVMRGGLTSRARVVLARVDSVRALLSSPNTSLGRIRRDSTLLAAVGDIRDELSIIRAQLDGSVGTAGRVLHDSAATNALAEAERQMALLFADIKKHPFRYLRF